MKHIAIIGGGVSGMAAAIAAAEQDPSARITILEHKSQLGKKILVTGNGHCNLANTHLTPDCYRSEDPRFIQTVIQKTRWQDTVRFFEDLGLPVRAKGNYLYPRSGQASSVLRVMTRRLKELGVEICLDTHITKIIPKGTGFQIHAGSKTCQSQKKICNADRVILACGGKAAPVQGSDGTGYDLAKSFGHTIVPVVPALVQLKVEDSPFVKASGVRTDGKVSVYVDGKVCSEDSGELQLTSYGISGIPVFQVSRYAAKGLYERKQVQLSVDFVPELSDRELLSLFRKRAEALLRSPRLTLEEFLLGFFPDKLFVPLLKQAGLSGRIRVPDLEHYHLDKLVSACKHTRLTITDTNGFESAQVCAGGVSTAEIDPDTMESRLRKGLYLAGELTDADGICGGYNICWAVTTGRLAGRSAVL